MKFDPGIFLECVYADGTAIDRSHYHNTYELIYVREGQAQFKICNSCYTTKPGSVLLISKLEEHIVHVEQTPYCRYYIQITARQLRQALDDAQLRALFISRPAGFCHLYDLSSCQKQAEALLEGILLEHNAPLGRSAAYALFKLLMILCYRAGSCTEIIPSETILQIQEYLDEHFMEDIHLAELADNYYISMSHLSHSFRKWTGISPKQYIMDSRLSMARELLLTSDLPISIVSSRCGFSDPSNFIRSFTALERISPLKYRHTQLNNSQSHRLSRWLD